MTQPAESNMSEQSQSGLATGEQSQQGVQVDALRDLPKWLWVVFPLALFVLTILLSAMGRGYYDMVVAKEQGMAEQATVIALIPGIGAGILILFNARRLPARWLAGWFLIVTLACVYFAGEECSWGQHLFQWETGNFFREHNDQDETNLHNMSSWLDQKPRMVVEIAILIGALILPIVRQFSSSGRSKRPHPDRPAYWFWPTLVCSVSALIMVVIRTPKRIYQITGWDWIPREGTSEIHEFYVALVLSFYLISVWTRLKSHRSSSGLSRLSD